MSSIFVNKCFVDIQRKFQHGTGICSVFILDTSESMAGEGVRQMKTAFLDILNGMLSFTVCYPSDKLLSFYFFFNLDYIKNNIFPVHFVLV